jgi:hypothetical protein
VFSLSLSFVYHELTQTGPPQVIKTCETMMDASATATEQDNKAVINGRHKLFWPSVGPMEI